MIEVKNVLVPTDFSEPTFAAAEYAVDLGRKYGATLHLFHVIEDPVVYLPIFESYPIPSKEEFERVAQLELDNWVLPDEADELTVERHWAHGSPSTEIVKAAKRFDADLIVIGSHGRGFALQLLVGSTAEQVVRRAHCPVLTVRWHGAKPE